MRSVENRTLRWMMVPAVATLVFALGWGLLGPAFSSSGGESEDRHFAKRAHENAPVLALTEEERDWLRAHPVIRVVRDPGWPPVEFADERGENAGMTSDYLALVEERLGVRFERVRGLSWQEAYARLKRWEIDMTTSVAVTPERSEFWAFTRPYMKIPIVIATPADVTYIADMRELSGKKVAAVDGYAVCDWIPRDFPDIRLVRVNSVREGVDALQRGEVMAFIDNMMVVSYHLARAKVGNVKIAGETPYVNAQSMAVRKDWAVLAGILDKALDSISGAERDEIQFRWLPIRYEHGFNYSQLWKILAIAAVVLLALLLWNRRLAREIARRVRAEEALRQSEVRLRMAMELVGLVHWEFDVKTGIFEFNEQFYALYGTTCEEQGGPFMSAEDYARKFVPPEDSHLVAEEVAKAFESTSPTFTGRVEHRIVRADGAVRHIVVRYEVERDESGRAVRTRGSNQDITERRMMEEALRASEQRLADIIDFLPDATFAIDANGVVIAWNRAMRDMTGVPKEAMIGKGDFEYSLPFYGTRRPLLIDLVFADEETIRRDYTAVSRVGDTIVAEAFVPGTYEGKGAYLWGISTPLYDRSGKAIAAIESIRDLTERQMAAETVKQAEARYRAIFENALEGIFQVTTKGRYIAANPAHARMLGYDSPEELVGSVGNIGRLFADRDRLLEVRRLVERDGRVKDFQAGWLHRDGTVLWATMDISSVRDSSGKGLFLQGCVLDMSERKRAEEERRRLEARLSQAQKMESVGRLAGGVAHDFNNMLGVIIGHVDMALGESGLPEPLQPHLREIQGAANRSADLVRQLLAFARKQIASPRVLDLNETVEGTLKMLRRLIGEDIDLVWRPGRGLWPVNMDPSQLDQILVNLVVNARDAVGGVGTITIETENSTLDEPYCLDHAGCLPGEYVQLIVSDTGAGMEREVLDHIFEPFYTTKGIGEGTGLGLATVYGIVRQNDGFINVYSEPSHGTIFRIYLPRVGGMAGPSPDDRREVIRPRGGTETVLLVEDDGSLLQLGRKILEGLGYTVISAQSPKTALAMAGTHEGVIHLLITDVVMPEMNGLELAETLLATWPGLKCLFMSGYTADVIAHRGILEEGVRFLQKPFTIQKLAAGVRQALDG